METSNKEKLSAKVPDNRKEITEITETELKELEKVAKQYGRDSWEYSKYLKVNFKHIGEEYSNHAEIIQKIQQKMSDIQNSHIEIFGVVVVASAIAITIIRVHQLRLEKAARKNRIRLEILDEFFPNSRQKK